MGAIIFIFTLTVILVSLLMFSNKYDEIYRKRLIDKVEIEKL